MGYLARDHCHSTAQEAAAAACAAYPLPVAGGVIACEGITPSGSGVVLQGPGASASAVVAVQFGSCNENEMFQDMGAVWSMGLLGLVIVYAFKSMVYRYVTGNQ